MVEFAFFEAVNEEEDCYNDEDADEYWDDEELDDESTAVIELLALNDVA